MRLIRLALVFVLVVASPSSAAQRKYFNDRWNFSIEYPSTLVPQPDPQNGDGRSFVSVDGRIRLLTYGRWVTEPTSVEEIQRDDEWGWIGTAGRVTYRATRSNWFVATGITDSGSVFYERLELRRDKFAGSQYFVVMTVVYPPALNGSWSPQVDRMSKTLRVVPCPQGC